MSEGRRERGGGRERGVCGLGRKGQIREGRLREVGVRGRGGEGEGRMLES